MPRPACDTRSLDLRQLQFFCALARVKSFTRAAEELGVAQPSLSDQIKRLEKILGALLFDRLTRGVELTPAGEALLPRARLLLEDAAAIPQVLKKLRDGVSGDLRVGAIPTILPYLIAPRLRQFVDAHMEVKLLLREATTTELLEQVENGVIDLAVLSLPVERSGLVRSELYRESLYLAVPENHALATAATADLAQMGNERLLVLKEGHCLRDETFSVCKRAKARFTSQFEADQYASIFSLIRSGFGLSIVPEMARTHAHACRLVPLKQRAYRRIGFVRLERHFVSKPMEAFIHFLRDLAAERRGAI